MRKEERKHADRVGVHDGMRESLVFPGPEDSGVFQERCVRFARVVSPSGFDPRVVRERRSFRDNTS